ncbi:RRNA maturation protein (Nop14) [Penicillium bovifimosum]|uniref:rRNA maturation protein (Nop14) n=1 Tax=Penicillium bovifimosum TaxID=126998 RepID=A0A9W9GIT6_9EURO|nr:RRNA maturation protein (Nop14) [Penicillium bovifimosum]KAJ5121217.1 RRNA maturation protein (Nop14) [Penicillium bovifimosum]
MPPSQLKQLKASLRETGVLGPQKSKKEKRQNAKTGVGAKNRNQREAALQAIRDRFNPFEIKMTNKSSKFDVTTRDGNTTAGGGARPGVTKSLGEERRRATLLKEMNSRNKVGGLIDRRFGENDPTMTPEERAAERFARESQRKMRKESMFNLEDDEDEMQLTHMGQSLTFDGPVQDDFEAGGELGDLEAAESDEESSRKRKRLADGDEAEDQEDFIDYGDEEQPGRKKTKAEVMKEVIAKSKFYKAERQQAKDDDEDLREELDKQLPDLFEALRGIKPAPKPVAEAPKHDFSEMNPERAAMMGQSQNKDPEKEYDQRLRQMTFDQRSKPTDRTKTEEEKAEEEAERLKKLESDRLRRMRGEPLTDDEEDNMDQDEGLEDDESEIDDATHFGLPAYPTETRPELAVEDEDDFIIDSDLVETDSNASLAMDSDEEEEGESSSDESEGPDGEDELINGMTLPTYDAAATSTTTEVSKGSDGKLAFTYPCPKDHESFLNVIKDLPVEEIPTVIQRIRALHHPRLKPGNKDKLGRFAEVLVEHVVYMGNASGRPPFAIIENIIRHIHSLAKTHPLNVTIACRAVLREIGKERPLALLPGDLVLLTGISSFFPTSDHFHTTATPAHLCLARYLGQCTTTSLSDLARGVFAASLCLQYQATSKRYMPEFINYTLNALCNLSPTEPTVKFGSFPYRQSQESVRLASSKKVTPRKLQFHDVTTSPSQPEAQEELKISLLTTLVSLLGSASDTWAEKSAFTEIFTPARAVLQFLQQSLKGKTYAAAREPIQSTLNKIDAHLAQARLVRRPLFLHDHKPLAIKTAIPKFEENFNPDKHYDPDRERAESNRLKKEFKRERKGAMRELRKDASFVAREKLREKKERDSEYEKKYKRLVAEIQSQEGRAANEYERARGKR